jgi:hypothetical protein
MSTGAPVTTVESILAERPAGGKFVVTPADHERDLNRFLLVFEGLVLAATEDARSGEGTLEEGLALLDRAKELVGPITGYARALGTAPEQIISLRCSLLGGIGAATKTVRKTQAVGRGHDGTPHDSDKKP